MTAREVNKTKLSKGILEMKFMKRTKEKVEKQLYDDEGKEYFGSSLSGFTRKGTGKFICESSFALCEGLIDGRLSYRGMNPEIERLMELAEQKTVPKKQETDVTDEQMADAYKSSMVDTMAKKFRTKQEHKSEISKGDDEEPTKKRPKFLKPSD